MRWPPGPGARALSLKSAASFSGFGTSCVSNGFQPPASPSDTAVGNLTHACRGSGSAHPRPRLGLASASSLHERKVVSGGNSSPGLAPGHQLTAHLGPFLRVNTSGI